MPSFKANLMTVEETEVDADYCYSQAAQLLSSGGPEFAREWRLLGDSLATLESQP